MKKYKYEIVLPKGFIVKIEGIPFEILGKVKVGSNTMPESPEREHKYWCAGCDEPFMLKGKVKKCPECGSKKIGLDEPIIRRPKKYENN